MIMTPHSDEANTTYYTRLLKIKLTYRKKYISKGTFVTYATYPMVGIRLSQCPDIIQSRP